MSTQNKIRIAYAGSATYNQLTAGSRFCNRVENPEGSHRQRGFLGGALYNENWEPTDGCIFQDFSQPDLVLPRDAAGGTGSQEAICSLLEAGSLAAALDWKPDFLLLQLNASLDASPDSYAAAMVALSERIRDLLPECRLYLVGPLPSGIPACGPVVERSCEFALAFNEALRQAVIKRCPQVGYIDLMAALSATEWQTLLSGLGGRDGCELAGLQWKLGQSLLFGFFEEAEQRVFPDKAASGAGEAPKVSPHCSIQGLPPSCDPNQGLIRDLPEGWWQQQLDDGHRLGKGCQLIFVGDSITHWWTNTSHIDDTYSAAGKEAFQNFFGKYRDATLNIGQASDTTADVLHRISCGALGSQPETFEPTLVSILIGTNNIGNPNLQKEFGGPDNSRQLAQGIVQVVRAVRRYCPRAKIVVTGILPTRIPYDMTRSKLEYANHLVGQLAESEGFYFLNLSQAMTAPDGSTIAELYNKAEWEAARLHLSEAGYERWAAHLVEFLED